METLDTYDFDAHLKSGGKYDWDSLLTGNIYKLSWMELASPGDSTERIKRFRASLYAAAKLRGVQVQTRTVNDNDGNTYLVLQAIK